MNLIYLESNNNLFLGFVSGKYFDTDGSRYEGEFENDKCNGHGIMNVYYL